MKENTKYIQYDLEREDVRYTTWLPEEFKSSRMISFKDDDGSWSRAWKILKSYPNSVRTYDQIVERSQDYKRTRKASDI